MSRVTKVTLNTHLETAIAAVGVLEIALRGALAAVGDDNNAIFMAHMCTKKAKLELNFVRAYINNKPPFAAKQRGRK